MSLDSLDSELMSALGFDDEADSGSPVRSEYNQVVPHILNLCRDFGVDPQAEQNLNLATLMRSLECLDRYYDAISDEKMAEKFVQNVFVFLRMHDATLRVIRPIELPAELIQHLVALREVLRQTGSMQSFIDLTSQITKHSREARRVTDTREYVRHSLSQGKLSGMIILNVLDFDTIPTKFSSFMTYVAATGNLYDDLYDADTDFASGQLAIKPGFIFKTTLRGILAERAARIVAQHPNKARALRGMKRIRF